MRESIPPAPAAKPKPNPKPKAAQNVEKPSLPTKPAHAATTAPPSDNNVSKNKSSDEPGYPVFVKNLPFEATVEMVVEEFSKFGAIKPGGIQVKKYQTDRFCFGFVEFESKHSMEAAIEAYTVYFGSWESYVEEKRTKTRVVDGVITHGDDNGNGGGGRFQSGRGGYHGDKGATGTRVSIQAVAEGLKGMATTRTGTATIRTVTATLRMATVAINSDAPTTMGMGMETGGLRAAVVPSNKRRRLLHRIVILL